MYEMVSTLAAVAHAVSGPTWASRVVLVWPSDLAHAPGALASSHSAQQTLSVDTRATEYLVPLSTAIHRALLILRPPAEGREAWDAAFNDAQRSQDMCERSQAALLQVPETCSLAGDILSQLRDIHVQQQADSWSCGPRAAYSAFLGLRLPCAESLAAEHVRMPCVGDMRRHHTSCMSQLMQELGPFWLTSVHGGELPAQRPQRVGACADAEDVYMGLDTGTPAEVRVPSQQANACASHVQPAAVFLKLARQGYHAGSRLQPTPCRSAVASRGRIRARQPPAAPAHGVGNSDHHMFIEGGPQDVAVHAENKTPVQAATAVSHVVASGQAIRETSSESRQMHMPPSLVNCVGNKEHHRLIEGGPQDVRVHGESTRPLQAGMAVSPCCSHGPGPSINITSVAPDE